MIVAKAYTSMTSLDSKSSRICLCPLLHLLPINTTNVLYILMCFTCNIYITPNITYEHYSACSISLTFQYEFVSQRSNNSVHHLIFREKVHGYELCPQHKSAVDFLTILHFLFDGPYTKPSSILEN